MNDDYLPAEISEGIATVRTNRPETGNALNVETLREIERAFAELEADGRDGKKYLVF